MLQVFFLFSQLLIHHFSSTIKRRDVMETPQHGSRRFPTIQHLCWVLVSPIGNEQCWDPHMAVEKKLSLKWRHLFCIRLCPDGRWSHVNPRGFGNVDHLVSSSPPCLIDVALRKSYFKILVGNHRWNTESSSCLVVFRVVIRPSCSPCIETSATSL